MINMKDRNTFLEITGYSYSGLEKPFGYIYAEKGLGISSIYLGTEVMVTMSLRGISKFQTYEEILTITADEIEYKIEYRHEKAARKAYEFCHEFLKKNIYT